MATAADDRSLPEALLNYRRERAEYLSVNEADDPERYRKARLCFQQAAFLLAVAVDHAFAPTARSDEEAPE